jgi:hypothetical protein
MVHVQIQAKVWDPIWKTKNKKDVLCVAGVVEGLPSMQKPW